MSDPDELRAFCIKASKKCTVLVDEAYNEITDNPEKNSMVPLIKEGYDVYVAKTFSKIYGMAGMRVGYMMAAPEKIEEIERFGLGSYAMNQLLCGWGRGLLQRSQVLGAPGTRSGKPEI